MKEVEEYLLKEFISSTNVVRFDSFRAGIFYYNVPNIRTAIIYQFQVPIEDVGGATLMNTDKSISFMRWIRKGIENGTMIAKTKR